MKEFIQKQGVTHPFWVDCFVKQAMLACLWSEEVINNFSPLIKQSLFDVVVLRLAALHGIKPIDFLDEVFSHLCGLYIDIIQMKGGEAWKLILVLQRTEVILESYDV